MKTRLTEAFKSGKWFIDAQAGVWKDLFWTVRPVLTSTGCAFLTPTGCSIDYAKRPTACKTLMPSANYPLGCKQPVEVTMNGTRSEMVYWGKKWLPYKGLLKELVNE